MEFRTATLLAQLGTTSYELTISLLKPSSELCLLRFTRPKNCPNLRLVTSSVSASLDRRLLILYFSHSTKLSSRQLRRKVIYLPPLRQFLLPAIVFVTLIISYRAITASGSLPSFVFHPSRPPQQGIRVSISQPTKATAHRKCLVQPSITP